MPNGVVGTDEALKHLYELLGVREADQPKPIPERERPPLPEYEFAPPPEPELPTWAKILEVPVKALDVLLTPIRVAGKGIFALAQKNPEEWAAIREQHNELIRQRDAELARVKTDERKKAIVDRYVKKLTAVDPATSPEWEKQYRELPWYKQLMYESPVWLALSFTGLSALKGWRAAATLPTAAKIPARVALAPLAGVEVGVGAVLKYGIIIPVTKGIPAGSRKLLQVALDQGLDKWIATQGRVHPEFRPMWQNWILKNKSWLIEKATDNMLRRQAEGKGAQYAANKAASDTVKGAEPLLLQAGKVKVPEVIPKAPTIKPPVKPPVVKPSVPEVIKPRYGIGEREGKINITESVFEIPPGTSPKILYTLSPKEAGEYRTLERLPSRERVPAQEILIEGILTREKMLGRGVPIKPPPVTLVKPLVEPGMPLVPIAEKPKGISSPEWAKFWMGTQEMGLTGPEVHKFLGVASVKDWISKGKTLPQALEELAPKSEANKIALYKALINPDTGATTPQYRQLAKNITGKKSIEEMTPKETIKFIEALDRYPEKRWSPKTGEWIPQPIPRTTAIVPENYFGLEFGEPTPIKYLTSQNFYAVKLGVAPLTQPLEIAKQELDLVTSAWSRAVDSKVGELNKAYKVTPEEKLVAFRNNKPTRASAEMARLLNKYENLPADLVAELGAEKVKLFSWFRNLNRTILNAENQVRELLGMPLIPHRQAYYRHIATSTAKEIWGGNYSLPSDLAYWASRIVGKRIFNPSAIQRKVADDLLEYFSKDLGYVTKSMLQVGLKEIYLSQPLKAFTTQLNVLSKGMMPFSSLSPAEMARAQTVSVLPASTRKWVTDYVNIVIKGQQTEFDASINRLITQSGIGGIFDKLLKEFGRGIGTRPITKMSQFSGRLIISATIGTKPRQIIRNLHQTIQNLALYGVRATLKAELPADKTLSRMLDQSLFLKSYARYEELPVGAMAKAEAVWLYAYGQSAIFNARKGMKAAYHAIMPLINNKGNAKYGWADPARTYKEPKGFLYDGEKEILLREMEFGSGCTQYQYIAMGMPEVFRHKTLVPLTRLQSWWMNYFFKFNREAIGRFWNGWVGWNKALKLPPTMRLNWLKYVILGGGVLTAMGYKRSFYRDVLPHWASPAGQFMVGAYSFVIADRDWERDKAKRTMFYSAQAFVPGLIDYFMWKELWDGERPLSSVLFYTEEFPPNMPTWGIPVLEREVEFMQRVKDAKIEIPKFKEQLGEFIPAEDGIEGYTYDMADFASDIKAITRDIPAERITEEEGFSDIVVMYKQAETKIDAYYEIPGDQRRAFLLQTTPESIRTGAYLVLWGKLKITGWVSGNPRTIALIELLVKRYKIPTNAIPALEEFLGREREKEAVAPSVPEVEIPEPEKVSPETQRLLDLLK